MGPMMSSKERFFALPVQMIEVSDGIVLKRGGSEFLISGTNAAHAVKLVWKTATAHGISLPRLRRCFDRAAGPEVDALLKNLVERRLLVPTDNQTCPLSAHEDNLDSFYWNFGQSAKQVGQTLNRVRLAIIGVNLISRQLISSLASSNYHNFVLLDHPLHRNEKLFSHSDRLKSGEWSPSLPQPQAWRPRFKCDELGDCIVVTSDFGGQQAFRNWNKFCLEGQ
jgi:hypothetical protein